ncbi:peptide/nickel transport system ATP-binding protein [Nonlabens sp. Hel1_33_55]|uniref:ABC transporter ATP-binding protein n=1 Tax=Nonlabens sp. Hel1_33_55 TaxID=1336802 RepID=UPI000875D894|nr:ABC transporter ATP-binding protein [Nonlabens sp. Hel1_33_55]SCY36954.1 peptide/nickel transport system ATP-binding protein [Nonlabens sp. Hel1_33_55]
MTRSSSNNLQIDVKGLNLSFKNGIRYTQVLHNIDIQLYKNEILAVVGESGSGKSVASKILMGLLDSKHIKVDAKKAIVLEKDVLEMERGEWSRFRGSEISMIFQEPMSSLNPTKTCGEQVAEILKIHTQLNSNQRKHNVLELFNKVKLPQPELTYQKYPHEISGGQMQRVMIAMAVACKPKILIADEPTTALDVTVQKEIMLLLKSLQQEYGLSILFISHDLSLVRSIADRIMVMYQGRMVETNEAQSLFDDPQEQYTKALIAARPETDRRLKRLPTIKDFMEKRIVDKVESNAQRNERHSALYDSKPILKVNNVVKDYALKKKLFQTQQYYRAVDEVSFELYKGESLGLVGESGCGKSTLGNMILGLLPITSGQILIDDHDISKISSNALRKLRKKIQIIFQDPFASLNPRIRIGDAIMEPMKWHGIGSSDKDRRHRVEKLLERVGLEAGYYNRYPHEFSGGQRQRIGIARAVALEPELIVCDESVSALDISVQAQVLNLLNEFKEDLGFSYIFISHDLSVVKYFCDRVIVMNKGKIEEENEADELYLNPQKEYTKKLIDAIP